MAKGGKAKAAYTIAIIAVILVVGLAVGMMYSDTVREKLGLPSVPRTA